MDINIFINRLKHGDSYIIDDGNNSPYQVNNPPNHLMIKAASIILEQYTQLQNNNEIIHNLQRQINELANQYETLRNTTTTTTTSS